MDSCANLRSNSARVLVNSFINERVSKRFRPVQKAIEELSIYSRSNVRTRLGLGLELANALQGSKRLGLSFSKGQKLLVFVSLLEKNLQVNL